MVAATLSLARWGQLLSHWPSGGTCSLIGLVSGGCCSLIGMVGASTGEKSESQWECMLENPDNSWMDSVRPVFRYFEERTPDTFTEVQEYSMTWHFHDADDDFGEIQAGDLQVLISLHISAPPYAFEPSTTSRTVVPDHNCINSIPPKG